MSIDLNSIVINNKAFGIKNQRPISKSLTKILFGASAFQYLNAACELNVFELLNKNKFSKQDIAKKINLQKRSIDILLLGLTSLKLINKNKNIYSNSHIINKLFKHNMWKLFKKVVAFEQYIVYLGQYDFTNSLKTNKNIGLQRIPGSGRDLYHRLHHDKHLEKSFYEYMHAWTELSHHFLCKHINFNKFNTLLDVGGGTGINSIALVKLFKNLKSTIFEIPHSSKIAENNIKKEGLSKKIEVHSGDMFEDEFPKNHDCILFSHQLVIWTPEQNIFLLKKAYNSLKNNGMVIIFSSMSNDNGNGPLMAALDSVYFSVLPAEGGMIYSWKQYVSWLKKVGFKKIKKINCYDWTPHGIIYAIK